MVLSLCLLPWSSQAMAYCGEIFQLDTLLVFHHLAQASHCQLCREERLSQGPPWPEVRPSQTPTLLPKVWEIQGPFQSVQMGNEVNKGGGGCSALDQNALWKMEGLP